MTADQKPHVPVLSADAGTLLGDYLSEHQLAKELGVTIRTLRKWRSLGEAPPVTRLGKRIYYARRQARAWLETRQVEAA
jgi:predicted site-specific integrase-resolvase